jgi:cell division protein FtsW
MRLLVTAYGLVIGLAAIAAWSSPYRRDRLLTFLDPWKDPTGSGLQNVQALISFGSGGIFGRGLGQGLAPLYYLPEAHTDMMFAVVGEELGLVGVAARDHGVLRLRLCGDPARDRVPRPVRKAARGGHHGARLRAGGDQHGRRVGLAPLTGHPLPFVSYGGSSLVVMLVGVGVLLNIAP